jgi:hypothetical protein
VVLAVPASAFAQSYTQTFEPTPQVIRRPVPATGYGAEVALGGGVMNFSSGTARGMTGTGGSWNLRLVWGTRSIVGFEAAYIGSAQNISATGLDPNAALIGNGFEGTLRINAPLPFGYSLLEPFAVGGLGWTRFDIVNNDFNTSSLKEKDNLLTVPVGAGLAASYRGFMVDGRFTYRFAYREDLIGSANLDSWIVSINLGSEF